MIKKLIIIILISVVLIFAIWQGFIKKEKPILNLAEVSLGNISQEVSETGIVKKGEEINLSFKNSGRIEKIYIKVGDEVKEKAILAKLDTSELGKQLQGATANLNASQSELDKMLAGASEEEIKVLETAVENAEISLENSRTSLENTQKNLEDVELTAETNLNTEYQDAQDTINSAWFYFTDTFHTLDDIYTDSVLKSVFSSKDYQAKNNALNSWEEVKTKKQEVKNYVDLMADSSSFENIDQALTELNSALNTLYNCLDLTEDGLYATIAGAGGLTSTSLENYKSEVASDKSTIQTQISYLNSSEFSILTTKNTNQVNINTAESQVKTAQGKVETAQGELKTAQDNLALKKASPREADLAVLRAQIKQAQVQVSLLENQITEATLKSPVSGQITKINKKVGEIAQPMLTESVISLIPLSPFEIKVDIYEEDVVEIKIGNSADIILVAFPDQTFKGKVISIDPAEKLIEGVVYYEVTIDFEKIPDGIRPGMTADVTIKTAFKENVLIIPEDAIQKKNGKLVVQVFRDDLIQDRVIEIGLKGSDDNVEVVSGLEEREKIILQ